MENKENIELIAEAVEAFRRFIVKKFPEMNVHSTWYLMNLYDDLYEGFRGGYLSVQDAKRSEQ